MAEMLPEGTKITCPKCGDLIAKALRDIFPGVISPAQFELHQDGHAAGQPMICKKCETKFAGWMIHTSEGWK